MKTPALCVPPIPKPQGFHPFREAMTPFAKPVVHSRQRFILAFMQSSLLKGFIPAAASHLSTVVCLLLTAYRSLLTLSCSLLTAHCLGLTQK